MKIRDLGDFAFPEVARLHSVGESKYRIELDIENYRNAGRANMWEIVVIVLVGGLLWKIRSIHIDFGPKTIETPNGNGLPRRRLKK